MAPVRATPACRSFRRLGALICALLSATDLAAQVSRPQEYQVKAAYLYSFGRFVEWPVTTSAADGFFVVCVLGQDPFGRTLDETVADVAIRERRVVVRRVARPEDARACHIVFIAASEDAQLTPTLATLEGAHVLTVGDMPQFAARGGMVEFTLDASRVRFAVNLPVAEDAGLVLSSELLRVATTVLRSRQPGD